MTTSPTFRVFVSSTFDDFETERDAVQADVFPKLRALCEERGARFQAVDLRWGIAEQAAHDQRTMPQCLQEIARCRAATPRPNFVVLLGDRYGWRPLPDEIPDDDFAPILSNVATPASRRLLTRWYRRDDNAVPPSWILQPRRVDAAPSASAAERERLRVRKAADWAHSERQLRRVLVQAEQRSGAAEGSLNRLTASATHREIAAGALGTGDPPGHAFVFVRSIRGLPADGSAGRFVDLDARGRPDRTARAALQRLRTEVLDRVGPQRVHQYEARWTGHGISADHLAAFCRDVQASLWDVIAAELDEWETRDPLSIEIGAHREFAAERRRHFVGRAGVRAHLHPSYASHQLKLFLSYRHDDGEDLARVLDEQLCALGAHVLRDRKSFRTGSDADHGMQQSVDDCDVLVVLETPLAGPSEYIKQEICLSLGAGVPIVWVRVGPAGPEPLLIPPAFTPDLVVDSIPDTLDRPRGLAIDINEAAHGAGGIHVGRMENFLVRAGRSTTVEAFDGRERVFEFVRSKTFGPYTVSPEAHLVQLFGRRPTADDKKHFGEIVTRYRAQNRHPGALPVMLSPVPSSSVPTGAAPAIMHPPSFLNALENPNPDPRAMGGRGPELLLFASFAHRTNPGREVLAAVQDLTARWLGRGGRIRYGGHPTITTMVNLVAANELRGQERERVTVFQTDHYSTPAALREMANIANVVVTRGTGGEPEHRAESLRIMREAMINDSRAAAAVVIGGLTQEDQLAQGRREPPGVEVEATLARAQGIPLFVLGYTGGQAAVMAEVARHADPRWSTLGNRLSDEENEDLATTADFLTAADTIWNAATR